MGETKNKFKPFQFSNVKEA